jgi:hypothetical protein
MRRRSFVACGPLIDGVSTSSAGAHVGMPPAAARSAWIRPREGSSPPERSESSWMCFARVWRQSFSSLRLPCFRVSPTDGYMDISSSHSQRASQESVIPTTRIVLGLCLGVLHPSARSQSAVCGWGEDWAGVQSLCVCRSRNGKRYNMYRKCHRNRYRTGSMCAAARCPY